MAKIYTLNAGEVTPWIDCRAFTGADLPYGVGVPGGGQASLEIAWDESLPNKADARAHEIYTGSDGRVLPSPLPDFIRGKNSGAVNGVTFAFGRAVRTDGRSGDVAAQDEQFGG